MTYIKGLPRHNTRRTLPQATLWLGLDDEFPWGAHKNRPVRWVLEMNPSYVGWVADNRDPEFFCRIRFTDPVLEQLRDIRQTPNYQEMDAYSFYRGYYRVKDRLAGS